MLTYSVKPRGGVVHALEVSEALARRGHQVELMALARPEEELFRPTTVPVRLVRHVATEPEFDGRIIGLTGTPAAIQDTIRAFRAYSRKVPGKDGGPYLMDHSSIVYLLDRNGRFVTHFTHEAKAEAIAAAVKKLL